MIRRDEEDSPSVAGCHGGGVDGLIDPIDPAAAATGGGGVGFTLYLEFLGGLIPLLKVFFFIFPLSLQHFFFFSVLVVCRRNFIFALFTTGLNSIYFPLG